MGIGWEEPEEVIPSSSYFRTCYNHAHSRLFFSRAGVALSAASSFDYAVTTFMVPWLAKNES